MRKRTVPMLPFSNAMFSTRDELKSNRKVMVQHPFRFAQSATFHTD
jgi:hypothetical protein